MPPPPLPPDAATAPIQWYAPAACPDVTAVAGEFGRVAARRGMSVTRGPLATAAVVAVDGGFRLTLTLKRAAGGGSRRLDAASCEELARAAALIVAMSVERETRRATAAVPPKATPTPTPAPKAATPRSSAPAPSPRRPSASKPARSPGAPIPWGARLTVGAVVDGGTLPSFSAGIAAGPAVTLGPWDVGVRYVHLPAQRTPLPGDGGGTARLEAHEGIATACVMLVRRWLRVAPCAGLGVAVINGESQGVARPSRGSAPVVSARAGALARAPRLLGPVGIVGRLELGLTLARRRFVVDDRGPVHEPTVATGRLLVGFELSLGR